MTKPHDIESIFSSWVARQENGDGESIEGLVNAHPEHRDVLLGMYAHWKEIQALGEQAARRESSLADRLRRLFGSARRRWRAGPRNDTPR